nr:MAG TPA: hypothetical protein [Caudoviricetes sp.]
MRHAEGAGAIRFGAVYMLHVVFGVSTINQIF